jgi:hypothetical protein
MPELILREHQGLYQMPLVSPSEMVCICDNRVLPIALGGEQDAQGISFCFCQNST